MWELNIITSFILLFTLVSTVQSAATTTVDYHKYADGMSRHDKEKIIILSEELYKEALLYVRQLFDVRNEHMDYRPFHVGIIIGKVREKYSYMLDLYKQLLNKRQKRFEFYPPPLRQLKPIHYIITLELVHSLEMEIDQLLTVLEDTALPGLEFASLQINEGVDSKMLAQGKKFKAEEEKAKSALRQKYLMKKLGMAPNMTTTKKRFIHQWPVEETWSLDKYNYY